MRKKLRRANKLLINTLDWRKLERRTAERDRSSMTLSSVRPRMQWFQIESCKSLFGTELLPQPLIQRPKRLRLHSPCPAVLIHPGCNFNWCVLGVDAPSSLTWFFFSFFFPPSRLIHLSILHQLNARLASAPPLHPHSQRFRVLKARAAVEMSTLKVLQRVESSNVWISRKINGVSPVLI